MEYVQMVTYGSTDQSIMLDNYGYTMTFVNLSFELMIYANIAVRYW